VLIEILKIMLPLLGGGAVGAFLNEWFRRRGGRIQTIPLIERANRLVSPKLKGFTLARLSGDGRLESIKNVREYQFTLHNTSTVHLQDVEVQFEFPTEDVEAWAERPTRSKTAPLPIDVVITKPWKKGYRWRIPQFPSTDSIDFTFRAVDPESDDYEVTLYKSDRVVIEKSNREPTVERTYFRSLLFRWSFPVVFVILVSLSVVGFFFGLSGNAKNLSSVSEAGCTLTVLSSFEQVNSEALPWQGPWQLNYRVLNAGTRKCVVQSDQLTGPAVTIEAAQEVTRTAFSPKKPKLVQRDISFGPDSPTHNAKVTLFGQD
jgi:hypothetical protein